MTTDNRSYRGLVFLILPAAIVAIALGGYLLERCDTSKLGPTRIESWAADALVHCGLDNHWAMSVRFRREIAELTMVSLTTLANEEDDREGIVAAKKLILESAP